MKNNSKITVGFIQMKMGNDPKQNLTKTIQYIEKAARKGAQIILLPELHQFRYFCQTENIKYFKFAENIPGATTNILANTAKKLNIIIVSSIFEKRLPGLYHNTSVVFEKNGEIAGTYRKMHIPNDPGFYEKYYFTPGDLGFKIFNTSIGKLGILICWDQWFPEASRLLAIHGADLILIPTAIGWLPKDLKTEKERQLNAWLTIQKAHAIANGLPIVVCNRIGLEPHPITNKQGLEFWGNSFIVDQFGDVLIRANNKNEGIYIQDIDLSYTEKIRKTWHFLRDRRVDFYQDLTKLGQ